MPKVKYYYQFEMMRIRIPFIFYLSRMNVYIVENICNIIDGCRIIDNICVYYLTEKNQWGLLTGDDVTNLVMNVCV